MPSIIKGNDKGDDASSWIKPYIEDLTKSSTAKQVTIGGISGWVAGYVFTKFGKAAATAAGGTLIMLHLANHYGYINIDWNRVNKDLEIAKKEFEKRKEKELPKMMEKVKKAAQENVVLATGFAGGFLLGMSSA